MFLGSGLLLCGLRYHAAHANLTSRLAGVWQGSAQIAGRDVALSLTLERKGKTLSGHLSADPGGEGNFDQMTVSADGSVSFDLEVANQAVNFTGKVVPGAKAMSGSMSTASYGEGTWSLTKQG
jgi:hypothetical protein